jgi:hypothetical protein
MNHAAGGESDYWYSGVWLRSRRYVIAVMALPAMICGACGSAELTRKAALAQIATTPFFKSFKHTVRVVVGEWCSNSHTRTDIDRVQRNPDADRAVKFGVIVLKEYRFAHPLTRNGSTPQSCLDEYARLLSTEGTWFADGNYYHFIADLSDAAKRAGISSTEKREIVVATPKLEEVSGISVGPDGTATAEYVFMMEPTKIGWALGNRQSYHNGSARFKKYDDGWRLLDSRPDRSITTEIEASKTEGK